MPGTTAEAGVAEILRQNMKPLNNYRGVFANTARQIMGVVRKHQKNGGIDEAIERFGQRHARPKSSR